MKDLEMKIDPEVYKKIQEWVPTKRKRTHHMTVKKWMREFDEKFKPIKDGKPNKNFEVLMDSIYKSAEKMTCKTKKQIKN